MVLNRVLLGLAVPTQDVIVEVLEIWWSAADPRQIRYHLCEELRDSEGCRKRAGTSTIATVLLASNISFISLE